MLVLSCSSSHASKYYSSYLNVNGKIKGLSVAAGQENPLSNAYAMTSICAMTAGGWPGRHWG